MTRRQIRMARCFRCVHSWRMLNRRPRVCPRCKSRYWNVPKLRPIRLGAGLGVNEVLGLHRDQILRMAREHGATRIRVFGSVRRNEADERSDVDLLVDWKPRTSLLATASFRVAVRELLGARLRPSRSGSSTGRLGP